MREEREAYEAHLKWLWVEESTLKKASAEAEERGIEKGLTEGVKKDRAEGREEGLAKGGAQILENML